MRIMTLHPVDQSHAPPRLFRRLQYLSHALAYSTPGYKQTNKQTNCSLAIYGSARVGHLGEATQCACSALLFTRKRLASVSKKESLQPRTTRKNFERVQKSKEDKARN